MNNLSDRLENIIDMVSPAKVIADIGCDHGYVAISLIERGKSEKAICADINKGPIDRAKEHISIRGLLDKIECRLSDGFEAFEIGELDSAIIAGMGGGLIKDILSKNMDIVKGLTELVLSPQSELDEFRKFLCKERFAILDERFIYDEGKYYTIIRCAYDGNEHLLSEEELTYGPVLLEKRDEVLYRYLLHEKEIYAQLYDELIKKGIDDRAAIIKEKLLLNEEVIKRYEMP